MQKKSFDPHARILHDGQYKLKRAVIDVPIKSFTSENDVVESVQNRIFTLQAEITQLEQIILEKTQLSETRADLILDQVREDAKKVIEEAEQHAFLRVQKSVEEKEELLQKASLESEQIILTAQNDATDIRNSALTLATDVKQEAQTQGYNTGHQEGLDQGDKDVKFVIERLHHVVAETARERERILVHSETQVVNLVVSMVKKAVKKLSVENQEVVVENTKAALELLRGAMTIFIHVSPYDFNFISSYREELFRMLESRAELNFVEDPSVDPGGVYIETDTGDIDATIRSQLEELENQMHFYMPIKVKTPETKKREQENTNRLAQEQKTIKKEEERQHIPKTSFAEREEYQSPPVETVPTEALKTPDAEKSSVIKDMPTEAVKTPDTEKSPVIEAEVIKETPIEDPALDAYKENSDTNSEESHDEDVIV